MSDLAPDASLPELTTGIVSAYVSHNAVPFSEMAWLIFSVHTALKMIDAGEDQPVPPAVPLKKSVRPDHIVCLEDGKKFKSLTRHLAAVHNLTPDQYRERWRLPFDYPMTAPTYAAARSAMAKKMGLGKRRPRRK